ncbi:hypothetical protein FQN60_007174 [Etheostoma spectabile]|uniref:Uncharacterized protein n=1 Tax=Etheostoma spectabile TaxID=54343 RepID=A0A5J5CDM3_9PERO|nr:hypothetical protein FQN60_007174 [Etheostoma spectabile]
MLSVSGLTVQQPIRVNLDVGVTYNNQLKDKKKYAQNQKPKVELQAGRFGEKSGVPGKVTLPVRVLDVQPDDVVWDVVAIKSGIYGLHIILVGVVPAALVMLCFYQLINPVTCVRCCTPTRQLSVLGEQLLWTGPEQDHAVNHPALRQPVDVRLRLHPPPLHWGCSAILGEAVGVLWEAVHVTEAVETEDLQPERETPHTDLVTPR